MIDICKNKLKETKKAGVKIIAADYDKTLYDKPLTHEDAATIVVKIAANKVFPVVISARDTTLKKALLPFLLDKKWQKQYVGQPIILAGANGATMIEVLNGRIKGIYKFPFPNKERNRLVKLYLKLVKDFQLQKKGLETFRKFLDDDAWVLETNGYKEKLVPQKLIDAAKEQLARKNGYAGFFEPAKTTFVLPVDPKQAEKVKASLRKDLGKNLAAEGDLTFFHITYQPKWQGNPIDGKVYAALKAMKYLGVKSEKQVAVFGDMPEENDRELLKHFKWSFTNNQEFTEKNKKQPHILKPLKQKGGLILSVHQAICYLIS